MSISWPTTRMDLVASCVAGSEGALAELQHHVYRVYDGPLQSYYRATSWYRAYGKYVDWEPDAMVHSFLTEKCLEQRFWVKYDRHGSRLRKYLIGGLNFHLHEKYREWIRDRPGFHPEPPELQWKGREPGEAADRLVVRGMIRVALAETVATLRRKGMLPHRRLLVAVHRRGQTLVEARERLEISDKQAKNVNRVIRGHVAIHFKDLLAVDGACPDRVDDEIRAILDLLLHSSSGNPLDPDPTREDPNPEADPSDGPDAGSPEAEDDEAPSC